MDNGGRMSAVSKCLELKFLQPFFDVNTKMIKQRLMSAVFPPKFKGFYAEYSEKPDLYGPIWIYSTLVCFLFISGNIARYIKSESDAEFTYNFKVIPIAFSIVFGVGIGLPLLMKFLLNMYRSGEGDVKLSHVAAVGIYGYSFTSFLVPVIVCAIPINWL